MRSRRWRSMAKGIMYVDNIRVEFDDEPTIMDVCR